MTDCDYCTNGREMGAVICGDRDGNMVCTRPPNHTGRHVACGAHHIVGSWPNERVEKGQTQE